MRVPIPVPIRRVHVERDGGLGLHLDEAAPEDVDAAVVLVEGAVRVLRDEVEEAVDLGDLLRRRAAGGDVLELRERDLSGARGRRGEAKVFERRGEREEGGVAVDAYVEECPGEQEDDGPDDAPAAVRGGHASGCRCPVVVLFCVPVVGPSFLAVTDDGPKRVGETGGNVVCRLCAELTDTPRVLVPGDLSKSDVASLAWCSTGRSVIFR